VNRVAHVTGLLLFTLALLAWPRTARAERDLIVPFHEGGHLVFDQLSGVRLGAASGVSYAGPLGVSFQSAKQEALAPGGPTAEAKTTTLWLAPSADVFVTDHLSVGGLVEVSHTFGRTRDAAGQEVALPGATSLSVVPRVGFYVPIGDRFGVWPRLGLGYVRAESSAFAAAGGAPVRETFQAMLLEADLALVYRFDETFFLRAGPSVSLTLGGRREQETGGAQAAGDATALAFGGVVGFGVVLDP
jgi:hypothetical protein